MLKQVPELQFVSTKMVGVSFQTVTYVVMSSLNWINSTRLLHKLYICFQQENEKACM